MESSMHHTADALSPRDSLRPTLPGQVKLDRIPGTIIIGNIATIAADKRRRSQYTQDVVSRLNAQDPKLNYVICHVKHSTAFDGEKGKDWGHSHQEFDIKLGGTIGYEIYWAKSGTFTILGDGGYINWAYFGNVKTKSADGKVIVFGPR
ncbi:hypothetical protein Hypma_002718 [Hypsizygus marmoreus]|uniref:Uncharacterized protein n=1 Tax=Hypsizygus marmoreus TaxID=39966 RepID=A0A369J338_HYPMA|nr:hypothetical protein Hypma_002718 [Hypsizygus marmoreus]